MSLKFEFAIIKIPYKKRVPIKSQNGKKSSIEIIFSSLHTQKLSLFIPHFLSSKKKKRLKQKETDKKEEKKFRSNP